MSSAVRRLDCFVDVSKVHGAERPDDAQALFLGATLRSANLEASPIPSDEDASESEHMRESGSFSRYALQLKYFCNTTSSGALTFSLPFRASAADWRNSEQHVGQSVRHCVTVRSSNPFKRSKEVKQIFNTRGVGRGFRTFSTIV